MDNTLAKDFKTHRITSKYLDNTDASTTEERHNYDTIRAQLDIDTKGSYTNLKFIIHDYKTYTSNFQCPIRLTAALNNSKSTLPRDEGYL